MSETNPSQYTNSGSVLEVRTPESMVKFEGTADTALARQRKAKAALDELMLQHALRGIQVGQIISDNSGTSE